MRKLVAFVLALATFCAGTAWALDTHVAALAGHAVVSEAPSGLPDQPADAAPCSDHCCHAAAHLMGIPTAGKHADRPSSGVPVAGDPGRFASVDPDPTTPPPLG